MTLTSADVLSSLENKYEDARETGDLIFFPSEQIVKHEEDGIQYEIRVCTALKNKASVTTANNEVTESKKPNPFAPPYNEKLYIGDMYDAEEDLYYAVLLNKFSVVPHHFLLVTKEFRPQTSPLLPSELYMTYSLLLAARKQGKNYLAFYNCGPQSGASQPHKHVQFIDAEDGIPPIERLARTTQLEVADRPFSLRRLSYANHVRRLPDLSLASPTEVADKISMAYVSLLDLVISTIRYDPTYPSGPPSYNMVLTLEHMHLIPRRWEEYTMPESGKKQNVNALGFAGMLLVKSDEELEAVKKETVSKILHGVGVESVHDIEVAGTSLEAAEDE
ncbi:ATP adenylyltransferase [Coniophora puteana RWD-64-598 SS2]|uniref:ATP adenylyltransferase n=1 Tax=Coniophora puteana (strain RWD-64-598) TaxID=741705 RepID=A0A5M3MVA7_CONPW|nr:ATP adenylyltransferase [Coniophora puteana RWD-64-598 SS2]EIW83056.1 ATP adenylyltransferase [Coniophora puteana RWD-64-598 SS2]